MSTNWRTEVDAQDYFGHQKKKSEVEQRRPVIRIPSDLVGPGIDKQATRITDFNDLLATYNGYYSAATGAANAPNGDEDFIGTVVMDSVFGGRQVFLGMSSGSEFRRMFRRNPAAPDILTWTPWATDERIPASARHNGTNPTTVTSGTGWNLNAPNLAVLGTPGTYSTAGSQINILRQGVYTGYLKVSGTSGMTLASFTLRHPAGDSFESITDSSVPISSIYRPFTFWTTVTNQYIQVNVIQTTGSNQTISLTGFQITRVGDAV